MPAARLKSVAVSALLAACAATASADFQYVIYDLGPISGTGFSDGMGISPAGHVVGRAERSESAFDATVWLYRADLGLEPGPHQFAALGASPFGTSNACLNAMNVDGVGAGWSHTPNLDLFGNEGAMRAMRWTAGLGLQDLGTLGGPQSIANDINAAGAIVGKSDTSTSFDGFPIGHPVMWANGNVIDLGSWGGITNEARGINDPGQVTGTASYNDGDMYNSRIRAFLWLPTPAFGLPAGLNDIDDYSANTPDQASNAYGINNRGQVVGWWADFGPGQTTQAFVWNPDITDGPRMQLLGTLADGFGSSFGWAINDDGTVVGRSSYEPDNPFAGLAAFIWKPEVGMRNLNALIEPGQGWFLEAATDINNNGWISGWGTHNGNARAFLAVPVNFCRIDFNNDGFLDFTDFDAFVSAFEAGEVSADFNSDGFLDFTDFDDFVVAFEAGC